MKLFRRIFIFYVSCLIPYVTLAQFSKITDVSLTFTPTNGGATVIANAEVGLNGLEVINDITLEKGTQYDLAIGLFSDTTSLNASLIEDGSQYLFFFGWTEGLFDNPPGDGNIDNRLDSVAYADADTNNLPIGFQTNWSIDCEPIADSGSFRVVLQFQPDLKTDSSSVNDGTEQFDLSWAITLEDPADSTKCVEPILPTLITNVEALFIQFDDDSTPIDTVIVTAVDPDGRGPLGLEAQGEIFLQDGENYTLTLLLQNVVDSINMTQFIQDSAENYQVFFEWTDSLNSGLLFLDPPGNGNLDNRNDSLNYNDFDANNLPIGLSTNWESNNSLTGTFRIVIQEQIGSKSATSTAEDGIRIMDVTWDATVDISTSISDIIEKDGLSVWPNPLQHQLRWELEGHRAEKIVLLDIFGREVFVQQNPSPTLELSQVANGTYTMLVYGESKVWLSRIVVMK